MKTYPATAANLKRAREQLAGENFCHCCGVGVIALREAEAAVKRVREIEAIEVRVQEQAKSG